MAQSEHTESYRIRGPVHLTENRETTSAAADLAASGTGFTGEVPSVFTRSNNIVRPRKNSKQAAKSQSTPPEIRLALRTLWEKAMTAALELQIAAKDDDAMGRVRVLDTIDGLLAKFWKLRFYRDVNWQSILNLAQGMIKQFFAEARVELLTVEECRTIGDIVDRYLGPSTKTVDDLNEAVRLIEDAGADPFAALSSDPTEE